MSVSRIKGRPFLALVLISAGLLALVACGGDPLPAAVQATPVYRTVVAETVTLIPVRTPTLSPPTAPPPTATWVPLITPSPTPGEKVPTTADVPRIGLADARAMVDAGRAVFFDVRGDPTYALAHIAGAVSLPAGDVALRYDELPADELLIFYCA